MAALASDSRLADALGALAVAAGDRVMAHYGCEATVKADGSPVTAADRDAEETILEGLSKLLPGVAVLAEESAAAGRWPARTDLYVAVDPLDGTREFLAGNGEFTVNIALIEAGTPVIGALYAPALERLWLGSAHGAEAMALAPGASLAAAKGRAPVRTRPVPETGPVALVSRSHPDRQAEAYLDARGIAGRRALGSSLKYAVIAEGGADITLRFAAISEWDIAAGHAVLAAAGGRMVSPEGAPLVYGLAERGFRTPAFVAASGALAARLGLQP